MHVIPLRWDWTGWDDRPNLALPATGDPVVWQIGLDDGPASGEHALSTLLSPDEQDRVRALRFERDRRRYLHARAALRLILSQYCGRAPGEIVLARGGRGKPYLAGGPAFSLAHSGGLMLLALHAGGSIGVDVEQTGQAIDVPLLRSHVLTPDESRFLDAQPADRQAAVFLRFWVVKEALLKATGEGLSRSMRDLEVDVSGPAPALVRRPSSYPADWRLASWTGDGHVAALALTPAPTRPTAT